MSDYLFDGKDHEGEDVDPQVEALEQLLGGFAHDRALRLESTTPLNSAMPSHSAGRKDRRGAWVVAAVAIAACVAIALLWPEPPPSLQIARKTQPPNDPTDAVDGLSCMEEEKTDFGPLPAPDDQGCVMEPAQGCRLVRVDAPPGWAVVDTPAGSNDADVDLDCSYAWTRDDARGTQLQVTRGAVTLIDEGALVWVPAGNELWSRPGRRLGLPLVVAASAPLRDAAARFDDGDLHALAQLLALLGEEDLGTSWNLLVRTEGDERSLVLERINALHSPDSAIRQALQLGLEAPRLDGVASPTQ